MKIHRRIPALLALVAIASACGSTNPVPTAPVQTVPAPTDTPAASGSAALSSPNSSAEPSTAPSPTKPADPATADWPVYHLDASRSGNATAFPALHTPLAIAWTQKLDGAVYAEPLVVSGHVIAATEGDSVYALDSATGATVWARKVGTPVRRRSLPCGDIDPLGITSTPAYDAQSGSLFVVAETGAFQHVMFALDAATGVVRWSRGVDLPGDDPRTHQQRGALAIGNGYVYFGFGGLAGDCGQYVGEVVGVPISGTGNTISYRVPVKREGAVWSTGGPVIDAEGNLYVSTGNGSSTARYDGSDSVVQLSPDLKLISRFVPATWAADNAHDLDLGSLSPTVVSGGYVFIAGKSGTGYVLKQGALGGLNGQVSKATVCKAFGGTAHVGATIYVPCRDRLRAVEIGTDGSLHVGWQSTAAGGPPVVGGGAVWTVRWATGTGALFALNPATGAVLASIGVGPVPHFASPTLWNGQVFVGTMSGIAAVRA
jgi:outer membrane protein assembly factor BamB